MIDLKKYIDPSKEIKETYIVDKKKQATLYLGIVSCGQLMLDYMDDLNTMNKRLGYKPKDTMSKGMEGTEMFITEMVNTFSKVVDINSNTSFTELQNKIDYQIKKQIKYVAGYAK